MFEVVTHLHHSFCKYVRVLYYMAMTHLNRESGGIFTNMNEWFHGYIEQFIGNRCVYHGLVWNSLLPKAQSFTSEDGESFTTWRKSLWTNGTMFLNMHLQGIWEYNSLWWYCSKSQRDSNALLTQRWYSSTATKTLLCKCFFFYTEQRWNNTDLGWDF